MSTENSTVSVCDRHAHFQRNAKIITTTEVVKIVCKLGDIETFCFLVNCVFRFPISQKCFYVFYENPRSVTGRAAVSFAISAVSLRFTLGPVILILVTAGSQDFVETLSLVLCLQLQLVTAVGASSIGYRTLMCPSDQVPDFSAGRCPLCL